MNICTSNSMADLKTIPRTIRATIPLKMQEEFLRCCWNLSLNVVCLMALFPATCCVDICCVSNLKSTQATTYLYLLSIDKMLPVFRSDVEFWTVVHEMFCLINNLIEIDLKYYRYVGRYSGLCMMGYGTGKKKLWNYCLFKFINDELQEW